MRSPRTWRNCSGGAPTSSSPAKRMLLSGAVRGERVGQQLQDRQRRDALARAALADQRQGLAAVERKRHPPDRLDRRRPAAAGEGDAQVADIEQGPGTGRSAHKVTLRGSNASRTASPTKIKQAQHQRQHEKGGEAKPRRLQIGLALGQQLTERSGARRQAEAEKVERGQGRDRAVQNERQKGDRRHRRVGQYMTQDDDPVGNAERARGAHIVEIAGAQELGAHDIDKAHPREQQHQA